MAGNGNRSSFRQPIRHGNPDTTALGYASVNQYAEVSAAETSAGTKFTLPGDVDGSGTIRSDIHSIDIHVKDVFEASAAAVLEFALGSAAGTSLGDIRVSAVGTYRIVPAMAENNNGVRTSTGVSADAFFNVAGTPIFVNVSAAGTAPDTGFAHLVLNYTPR